MPTDNMGKLGAFFRLSWAHQLLLVRAAVLVSVVRLMLNVLPFKSVYSILEWMARQAGRRRFRLQYTPAELASSVYVTSKYLLNDTPCLTRALAVELLLRRRKIPSDLRIGVARSEDGGFKAHAWVESEGDVLIGYLTDLNKYTVLPSVRRRMKAFQRVSKGER